MKISGGAGGASGLAGVLVAGRQAAAEHDRARAAEKGRQQELALRIAALVLQAGGTIADIATAFQRIGLQKEANRLLERRVGTQEAAQGLREKQFAEEYTNLVPNPVDPTAPQVPVTQAKLLIEAQRAKNAGVNFSNVFGPALERTLAGASDIPLPAAQREEILNRAMANPLGRNPELDAWSSLKSLEPKLYPQSLQASLFPQGTTNLTPRQVGALSWPQVAELAKFYQSAPEIPQESREQAIKYLWALRGQGGGTTIPTPTELEPLQPAKPPVYNPAVGTSDFMGLGQYAQKLRQPSRMASWEEENKRREALRKALEQALLLSPQAPAIQGPTW